MGYWCGEDAAPFPGVTVPANAPALVQYTAYNPSWGSKPPPRARLLGPDGAEIPLASRAEMAASPLQALVPERLLTPGTPLQPGAHTLVYGGCQADQETRNVFTVGPAAPLPTRIGAIRLQAQPVEALEANWVSGCGWTAQASSVQIVLEPSPELQAFLPLARFTLTVDGTVWETSAYGSDRVSNPTDPAAVSLLRPYTFCDPRFGAGADGGRAGGGSTASGSIPPGRHRAELSVHIAGADQDPPPLAFELVTTCGDVPDGRQAANGGAGGCAVSQLSAPGQPAWLALLVLCTIGLRRGRTGKGSAQSTRLRRSLRW